MLNKKRSSSLFCVLLFFALLLSGCADSPKHMHSPTGEVATVPEKEQSMIIFYRSSSFGKKIPASLFEIKGESLSLAGILLPEEKLTYTVKPGKRLFMVVGETVDFMAADLMPNRTYYAHITPIMGNWVGHFSLRPVHRKTLYSSAFKSELENCEWVEKRPTADAWAKNNLSMIQAKRKKHYPEWLKDELSADSKLQPKDWK